MATLCTSCVSGDCHEAGTYGSSRLWHRKPEASALGWLMNTWFGRLIVLQHWLESGCDITLHYDAGDYGAGNDIYDLALLVDLSEKADQAGYGGVI